MFLNSKKGSSDQFLPRTFPRKELGGILFSMAQLLSVLGSTSCPCKNQDGDPTGDSVGPQIVTSVRETIQCEVLLM